MRVKESKGIEKAAYSDCTLHFTEKKLVCTTLHQTIKVIIWFPKSIDQRI